MSATTPNEIEGLYEVESPGRGRAPIAWISVRNALPPATTEKLWSTGTAYHNGYTYYFTPAADLPAGDSRKEQDGSDITLSAGV